MLSFSASLDDRVCIVTGGGTGLGRAISLALARAGAHLVLAARRREPLEEVAAEVQRLGRRALAVPTDATDSRQVNQMVERTLQEFGQVDVLVNNAGAAQVHPPKPIWEITDEEWHRGTDINLTSAFYCARAVAKAMADRRRGAIVNNASFWGFRGRRDSYQYTCAKGGLLQLTRTLAISLARYNIRVNAIAPGYFPVSPEELLDAERRGALVPIGRPGRPDEVGSLVVFLASDACPYMTGAVIPIDGGTLAAGMAPAGYAPSIPLPE